MDHKRGPEAPRKRWFPVMVEVYHLQKRHPDAGEFRIWSLLARMDLSVRTVGRIMAINRQVYDDIRMCGNPGPSWRPNRIPTRPAVRTSISSLMAA